MVIGKRGELKAAATKHGVFHAEENGTIHNYKLLFLTVTIRMFKSKRVNL
jgi:hypothetical protein